MSGSIGHHARPGDGPSAATAGLLDALCRSIENHARAARLLGMTDRTLAQAARRAPGDGSPGQEGQDPCQTDTAS